MKLTDLKADKPAPGECSHWVKREKRTCENPASWTAEYLEKGKPVKKRVCQLHALRYEKDRHARIARIMAIGEFVVEAKPLDPHCPKCGASTAHPVLKEDGRQVCPFCGAQL